MIEIGGMMKDLLFWDLMYLHPGFICCRRYLPPYSLSCYLLHNLSRYITYKKIDIRNSSEYEMSVGDT